MSYIKEISNLTPAMVKVEYDLIRKRVLKKPRAYRDLITKIHLRNEYERLTGQKIKEFK